MAINQNYKNRLALNMVEAQEVVVKIEESLRRGELPTGAKVTISQSEFIKKNIMIFQRWGIPKRSVYKILMNEGLELGNFESFAKSWSYHAKKAKSENRE